VALQELSPRFGQMYSEVGRPSIPPERLLKASLLMALYTVRSERMFCEQLDYNLLFRWFLDLNWDEPSFDHSTFSRNRTRLLEHDVAGEFFRTVVAAAREQLVAWGTRNAVPVIAQESGDPGAVIFDALSAARARGAQVVIADTAGRLPTQLHLMEEIRKVKRVAAKAQAGAPHEVLLVLDANTGQNALAQVRAFDDALKLTGLIVTKLDGTAKGGVICAIARERPIPLLFIGVGEGIDDLRPFVARDFAEALLG